MIKIWDPSRISKSPPSLTRLEAARHQRRLHPRPAGRGVPPSGRPVHRQCRSLRHRPRPALRQFAARCEVLGGYPPQLDFFDAVLPIDAEMYRNKKQKQPPSPPKRPWTALLPVLEAQTDWTRAMQSLRPARRWPSRWKRRTAGCCSPWHRPCPASARNSPGGGTRTFAAMMGREELKRVKDALGKL